MKTFMKLLLVAMMTIFITGRALPSEYCGVCQYVATITESYLANNQSVVEIEQVLDKACNILPQSIIPICDEVICNYFPSIVTELETKYPPAVVCQDLGLCNGTLAC